MILFWGALVIIAAVFVTVAVIDHRRSRDGRED